MKFSTNQWIGMVAGALVFLVIGYVAGSAYAGSHPNMRGFGAGQDGNAAFGARIGGAGGPVTFSGRGGAGAGIIAGTILSQGNGTITIATQGGGSRIVLVSTSTAVMTESTSSLSTLKTGQMVSVIGSTNSDGSVSARTIQAR